MDKDLPNYSRAQFSRFFRAKYWRLIQAVFNKNEKRPDYSSQDVIERVGQPYRDFAATPLPSELPSTPRHIWILWQQGWDKAPPIVQHCAQSWKDMNPGWEVHLVDEASIGRFAPEYKNVIATKASRTARSNIARLSLLKQYGGVWADSTLFCQQPLDKWLPKVMAEGFFMFSKPRPYRYSDIWFLASFPQTHLISSWLEMVADYWSHFSRPHHYYWMEYLFEFLAQNDLEIASTWKNMPKISAIGPLVTQGIPFETNVPPATQALIRDQIIPVHKLSHKWRFKGSLTGTPVGELTGLKSL